MLARDQNLLLQPDASPSAGFRHVYRSSRLAQAWQKLGGTATLVHDDLPGSLIRQLNELQIEVLPGVDPVERIASKSGSGWIVVDGTSGHSRFDYSKLRQRAAGGSWKLAAMEQWSDTMVASHGNVDLLIAPNADSRQMDQCQTRCVLSGDRYRIPITENIAASPDLEADAFPRLARKILVWLSEGTSVDLLAQTLADVIDVASDRTSIDIVGDLSQRDSVELVRLKKANPNVTFRFWGSVERRLQSMAPVQLAIVDNEKNSVALGTRGIPVVLVNGVAEVSDHEGLKAARTIQPPLETSCRAKFRRSLGRLIRDRDHRQDLANVGFSNCDEQAADRVARRLASDHLQLESAVSEDWPAIRRWRSDPESRASALRCMDRESDEGRSRFTRALNLPSSSRLMLRLPGGEPIGMALLDQQERSGNGQIHVGILIKPSFRNQGYGSALLERVIERLSADGNVGQMIVQTTANHRAAYQMARKAGMTPVAPAVVDGIVAHQFGIELTQDSRQSTRLPMKKSA